LVMLSEHGGGKLLKVKLEEQVKSVCKDFSAVTVDPRSGDVFISSDESSTVAQVRLSRKGDDLVGRLVSSFPVRDGRGEPLARIEGLAFDSSGDLFVLTENDSELHKLSRR
ncbi:MAG: SdiA-regulated domain-containing protein, partial [Myxococcaceae bacterium]